MLDIKNLKVGDRLCGGGGSYAVVTALGETVILCRGQHGTEFIPTNRAWSKVPLTGEVIVTIYQWETADKALSYHVRHPDKPGSVLDNKMGVKKIAEFAVEWEEGQGL